MIKINKPVGSTSHKLKEFETCIEFSDIEVEKGDSLYIEIDTTIEICGNIFPIKKKKTIECKSDMTYNYVNLKCSYPRKLKIEAGFKHD